MDLDLNLLDLVLFATAVYAVARGFVQGALSQVAAFGGGAVGLVLGAFLAPRVASLFLGQPGATLALMTLAFVLIMVAIGQGLGFAFGLRMRHAAHRAGAGAVDKTAGMVVGALGLLVVVWLVASMLVQGPSPALAQQVRESRIVGWLDQALPPAPDVFSRVASYLDHQGFPQVFSGLAGGVTAPPVPPTSSAAVQAAAAAGQASTVQVEATGCNGISSGTGFVTQPGFVVTNAHVIAGGEAVRVRDQAGEHTAVAVHFDPQLDLAVVSVPGLAAPPIGWVATPAQRETEGATLGFPGGQREMAVKPATVRARGQAVGRDIYGRGLAEREILTLGGGPTGVQRGDSGGPFVTSDGLVGGVVFAASPAEPGMGFALTAEQVRDDVAAAVGRNEAVTAGECRF